MECTANGYMIDAFGLFPAPANHTSILETIIKKYDDFAELLKPGDLFLLDRGFRNIAEVLEKKFGLNVQMPCCSNDRMTTLQANQTRFVTKCRWVIEAVNGVFKQHFKALEKTRNTMINHIMDDFRIAASLINCFHSRFFSDVEHSSEIVKIMKTNLTKPNHLEKFVLNRKAKDMKKYDPIEAFELEDFPKLTQKQLIVDIAHGTYQLAQSFSYLAEHFNTNGKYQIFIEKDIELTNDTKKIFAKI